MVPKRALAFTLIEMLISLAITMIMMGAVVTLFGTMTDSIANSRSIIETSERLRSCRNMLQADLDGMTATPAPPLRPENDEGYIVYAEGKDNDSTHLVAGNATAMGDCDDYLMFTTRRSGEPFVGKAGNTTTESQVAEVVYFTKQDGPVYDATASPPIRLHTLYRRVLLVTPSLDLRTAPVDDTYYNSYDVAARVSAGQRVGNTLGDLTKPELRFRHTGTPAFPFQVRVPHEPFDSDSGRLGDDVVLTNVLAFDVQAWDEGAPVFVTGAAAIAPGDSDFSNRLAGTPSTFGAYADLGWSAFLTYTPPPNSPVPQFNSSPDPNYGVSAPPFIYDSYSSHYDGNGLDDDSDGFPDAGTDGQDSNNNGVIDDSAEFDALPPYRYPLRGLRIRIRVYELSSQQVRQVVVIRDVTKD